MLSPPLTTDEYQYEPQLNSHHCVYESFFFPAKKFRLFSFFLTWKLIIMQSFHFFNPRFSFAFIWFFVTDFDVIDFYGSCSLKRDNPSVIKVMIFLKLKFFGNLVSFNLSWTLFDGIRRAALLFFQDFTVT